MRSSPSSCPRSLFPSYFSVAHPTRFYSKLTPILTTSFYFTVLFKVIRENLTMNNFHQAIYDMIKPAWSPIGDYWDDVILEKLEIVKLFPQELTIFLPSTSWQNLAARRTTVTMTFTRLCTIWSNLHGRPSLTIEMMSSSRSWRSSNSSLRSSQYSYHRPLGRTWRQDEQL